MRLDTVRTLRLVRAVSLSGVLAFAGVLASGASVEAKELPEKRLDGVRLQVYLDQKGFGPGYIDGKPGRFTKLAYSHYVQSQGKKAVTIQASNMPKALVEKLRKEIQHPLALAVVPRVAEKYVDAALPTKRADQAGRKDMPYRSVAEFMAERYHTSVGFLEEINGKSKVAKATVRTPIMVPNVDPFRIELLGNGRTHREQEQLSKRMVVVDTKRNQLLIYQPIKRRKPKVQRAVPVAPKVPTAVQEGGPDEEEFGELINPNALVGEEAAEKAVEQKDERPIDWQWQFSQLTSKELVATFPITPGKPQFIRRGVWDINIAIELPEWRYDKSLLETGERSAESLTIPGGPNNPVGVFWHGLSRKGIGIHGTAEPETIGRTTSAGCIRLSNWNVVRLPLYVRPGAKVLIK